MNTCSIDGCVGKVYGTVDEDLYCVHHWTAVMYMITLTRDQLTKECVKAVHPSQSNPIRERTVKTRNTDG